jgi:hypothetical protein
MKSQGTGWCRGMPEIWVSSCAIWLACPQTSLARGSCCAQAAAVNRAAASANLLTDNRCPPWDKRGGFGAIPSRKHPTAFRITRYNKGSIQTISRRVLLADDKLFQAEYLGSGTFIISKPKRKKAKIRQTQLKNPQRGSRK